MFCFVHNVFSMHMCLYIAMFISYNVYLECRGRVKTNVPSIAVNILAIKYV